MNGITDSMDMSLSKFQEIVKDREAWHAECGVSESDTTYNWTTPTTILSFNYTPQIAKVQINTKCNGENSVYKDVPQKVYCFHTSLIHLP